MVVLAGLVAIPAAAPVSGAGKATECQGKPITIPGTSGPDAITGTPGDDVIDSQKGDDIVVGGAGDDTICTGSGDDTAVGDFMDEVTKADLNKRGMIAPLVGNGKDSIQTGAGDDIAVGDVLRAINLKLSMKNCKGQLRSAVARGFGRDRLQTGPGDDTLTGDVLLGTLYLICIKANGAGDDYFSAEGGEDDRVVGDVLYQVKQARNTVAKARLRKLRKLCFAVQFCQAAGTGDDSFFGRSGGDYIVGDAEGETSTAMGTGDDSGTGGSGEDTLIGDATSNIAALGGGADSFAGNSSHDWLIGDASSTGYAAFDQDGAKSAAKGAVKGGGPDKLSGGGSDDKFEAGPKKDKCSGGGGNHDKDLSKPPCEKTSGIP
jgi:Ca2+-binding RTX toxin-like protein